MESTTNTSCSSYCLSATFVKDVYIPYVEDSVYINQSSYRNVLPKTNRLGLCKLRLICLCELEEKKSVKSSDCSLIEAVRSSLM